jgi:hypothetical protein
LLAAVLFEVVLMDTSQWEGGLVTRCVIQTTLRIVQQFCNTQVG